MMKATLRSAVLLGIAALGMGVASLPAFAEVQNVKVSGDVTVRAFHRECLDLNCGDDNLGSQAAGFTVLESEDDFFMHTIGVNVAADLTENVSAFIRLANERDWDSTIGANAAAQDVDLSQGYVTLKELFYSPLTLRVGTQPIRWGRGLVLGSNLLPTIVGRPNDANGSITANEFTDFTAFDALRATLDLSGVTGSLPLTVDAVYIKLDENTTAIADDVNLMGLNFGTRFDSMNGEAEAYYLNKRDKVAATAALDPDGRDGSVNTLGLRGSANPAEGASVWGELAYQFGRRATDFEAIQISGDSQQAWAANFGADYTFADVATTPKLGGEWKFFSGKDRDAAVMGWHPIAPGYYTTALREFQTRNTLAATAFYPNTQTGVTSGQTNQHELAVFGSFKPVEDLTVNQRLSWFVLPVGSLPPSASANAKREHFLGTEWDTVLTYDYTDDVQFGLIYGLFLPGSVFRSATSAGAAAVVTGDDAAQELITSVSVKF